MFSSFCFASPSNHAPTIMAAVAIDSSHLLESRMFSQVLNLYVANTVTHFITSTLSLLCFDHLCDSCVGLQRRENGNCPSFQNSCGVVWDAPFLLRESVLAAELRAPLSGRQCVVSVDRSPSDSARGALELYRCEILDPIQVDHALIVFITDMGTLTRLQFTMLRNRGGRAFDSLEIERVATLCRYIENAWGLLNQRLATRALMDGISAALRNYHRGTLMLDSSFRVVWHNRAARECLELWRGGGRSSVKASRSVGRLPEDILCVCQRVRNQLRGPAIKSELHKTHLVRHAIESNLVATVKLCGGDRGGIAPSNIVVQFENSAPTGSSDDKPFIDSLTSGEREVARLIRTGMSNQEIADRLGKTVVTIKFHLHRIFKKAAVKNRARLMLRLTDI